MKKTTSLDYFKDKWTLIEYAKKGKKENDDDNINDNNINDNNINKNALLKGKCLI